MKRIFLVLLGVTALATVGASSAAVSPASLGAAHVGIRHSHFGCHQWERGGMAAGVAHTVVVHAGRSLTLVNGDLADHMLVQTSGPTEVASQVLPHVGSSWTITHGRATAITLHAPGTYIFETQEAGHQAGREGLGAPADVPDHALTLKVIVVSAYE